MIWSTTIRIARHKTYLQVCEKRKDGKAVLLFLFFLNRNKSFTFAFFQRIDIWAKIRIHVQLITQFPDFALGADFLLQIILSVSFAFCYLLLEGWFWLLSITHATSTTRHNKNDITAICVFVILPSFQKFIFSEILTERNPA